MKSHDHLIEVMSELGVFLTEKEFKAIRRAVKRDRRVDKKLKKRKIRLRMISCHGSRINNQ